VARTVNSDADIILLDEPLAAMGVKEGAQILDLIARLKEEGNVSMIVILHNYVQVFEACDRVNLIQDGLITLDKPTSETSVDELNELVVSEYRRAREQSHAEAAQQQAEASPTPEHPLAPHRDAARDPTLGDSEAARTGIDTPKRE